MRGTDVYRALLWCYPAEFRREYGTEMVRTLTEQLADARRSAGPRATAAVWAATLADLPGTAFKEHRHVIAQDLRYAARLLAASPGFTAVAVLSLALGMGANTAIFSLLDNVLMQTLPVRQPRELVLLTDPGSRGVAIGSQSGERSLLTYREFRALQDRTGTLSSVMAAGSAVQRTEARIAGSEAEPISVRLVSTSYFDTLGVPAAIGRTFDPGQEAAPGTVPFAVISDDYWHRRFGAADVIGRSLSFRGGTVSIIGVAPPSFFGETVGERPDAWVPLAMQPAVVPGRDWLHESPANAEKVMWLHVFGRLQPGTSLDRAQADANLIFQQELTAFYASIGDAQTRARFLDQTLRLRGAASGASALREQFSEPLFVLLGAAVLVLLLACANLGNLLLARTTARTREMTVRLALGASRTRLIRQLLTESLVLACLGTVAGIAMALLLRQGLLQLVSETPIALPTAFGLRTPAFVVGLTLTVGVLLGLLPALRITGTEAATSLREQGRGIAGPVRWLRIGKAVIVGQLALSLPLLVGAGLLVRTLTNLQQVDLGYPKDGLLTIRVDARAAGYDTPRQTAAIDQLLDRVRALPGVAAAAYSNNGLFNGSDSGDRIIVEGYTSSGDDDRGSSYDQVGPRYFSTLGIPIRLGREITGEDIAGGRAVCVINDAFARRFFDGRTPIGQHVTQVYADQRHTYEIVGVARDSRQGRLRGDIERRFYVPAARPAAEIDSVSFLVRPRGAATGVLADVRRVIEEAEPRMSIASAGTLADDVDRRMVQDRLLARMSIAFGIVAVLLAAIGIYGVLSYGVARRTSEIGIRKALGAQRGAVVAMILRETAWLLLAGLVGGVALAMATIRLIASRLYALAPTDPLSFTLAVAGLVVVALLATWLPAYRASRVDPLIALRQE